MGFFDGLQGFINSITTENHYASSNTASSGYGQQGQPNPYNPNARVNRFSTQGVATSSTSLNRVPYSPGMRSAMTSQDALHQVGTQGPSHANQGVELQSYVDGLPPPPLVSISWDRIERWLEEHHPELEEQLGDPVTPADLNELEADLDCSLPADVRDSYLVHDGQEKGGRPTGLFFGVALLDLEAISEEYDVWKVVSDRLVANQRHFRNQQEYSEPEGPSKSSHTRSKSIKNQPFVNSMPRQGSVPEGAIQLTYAHPAWIPVAKDFSGNNIAIDLAPGTRGTWGQVILFGHDQDIKYVVAPSWAAFLQMYADDLESGNWTIDDDDVELVYVTKKGYGQVLNYMDVLKKRVQDQLKQQQRRQQKHRLDNNLINASNTSLSKAPAGVTATGSRQASLNLIDGTPNPNRNVTNLINSNGKKPLPSKPVNSNRPPVGLNISNIVDKPLPEIEQEVLAEITKNEKAKAIEEAEANGSTSKKSTEDDGRVGEKDSLITKESSKPVKTIETEESDDDSDFDLDDGEMAQTTLDTDLGAINLSTKEETNPPVVKPAGPTHSKMDSIITLDSDDEDLPIPNRPPPIKEEDETKGKTTENDKAKELVEITL